MVFIILALKFYDGVAWQNKIHVHNPNYLGFYVGAENDVDKDSEISKGEIQVA